MAFRLPGIGVVGPDTERCLAHRVLNRALLAAVLLSAVVSATGCFDVHSVPPGSLVIDNFDDGAFPADATFVTYGAAGLFRDVTDFATLGFDAEIDSGNPPLPSDAQLQVQLGCSTVRLTDGSEPGDVYLLQDAAHSSQWAQIPLSIANFSFPFSPPRPIEGGAAGCLERVDYIGFVVEAQLPDGQSGAGTLKIDNVHLK